MADLKDNPETTPAVQFLNPASNGQGDKTVSVPAIEIRNANDVKLEVPPETTPVTKPYEDETNRLRLYLRAYFYSAFKCTDRTCSFHIIYCFVIIIQVIKVILISNQMITFGHYRANFSSIVNRGHITLRHLLLKDWNAGWETLPYPPAHGEFAEYDITGLEDRINYAVERYYNAAHDAIGFYMRTETDNMTMTMTYFDFPGFHDSASDSEMIILTKNLPINAGLREHNDPVTNQTTYTYSVHDEFKAQNLSEPIKRLLALSLDFSMHSVRVYEKVKQAQCLSIAGKVSFVDFDNNGQVIVNLDTLTSKIVCRDIGYNVEDFTFSSTSKAAGGAVIAFSILSLLATVGVMLLAVFTFVKTKRYMRLYYRWYYRPVDPAEKDLPWAEYGRFVKLWDILTILADCLTLHGTVWLVFQTQRTSWILSTLDSYTIVLSVGGLLAWFSLLRYFRFHNKFNLLFNTMYRAFFNVVAYIVCVAVLFVGFWLCGYVAMSPYHVKFRTLSSSAETLLSVVNGDEIYATLSILEADKAGSSLVFWFSRIYIAAYVTIFTIIVINLLIAIFMSSYEAVQCHYKEKEDDRELSPVEKALKHYLESSEDLGSRNALRTSLYDMIKNGGKMATHEEGSLRRELMKLVRVSKSSKDIVLLRRRTLKAFYEDDNNESRKFSCCCVKCSFALISNHSK